jgi:hypothetical protein
MRKTELKMEARSKEESIVLASLNSPLIVLTLTNVFTLMDSAVVAIAATGAPSWPQLVNI